MSGTGPADPARGPALRVRGVALPSGESVEFWIRDGTLTYEPVPGCVTVVDGGRLLPGLVDAHTHPPPGRRSAGPVLAGQQVLR